MQYHNFITAPRENTGTKGSSYYKEGVRVKYPKKSPALRMQILPSYDLAQPNNPQGYLQCLVDGQPSPWFGMIQSAKFVGHGDWKSAVNILSLGSFEGKEPCPYAMLYKYCKDNPDWKYLVTNQGKFGTPDYVAATLKPIKNSIFMNIVNVDNPGDGVAIGEFSYSVADSLLNPETGLVFQRNLQLENYPGADVALAQNPMLAYANGDITDPAKAPVMVVELPPVKPGHFGQGYTCRIDVQRGQVARRACSDIEMASRYHMEDPESFLNIPTGQDIVDSLVRVLKGHTNANGVDETCAIKEAVGDMYRVDTVSAPGATSTVQGYSFAQPAPVAPVQPPQPPPPGFGANPANTYVPNPVPPAQPVVNPAPVGQPAAQVGAIPGEMGSAEAALAESLAARMRQQMAMRR